MDDGEGVRCCNDRAAARLGSWGGAKRSELALLLSDRGELKASSYQYTCQYLKVLSSMDNIDLPRL